LCSETRFQKQALERFSKERGPSVNILLELEPLELTIKRIASSHTGPPWEVERLGYGVLSW
jgi:hypothetical protein